MSYCDSREQDRGVCVCSLQLWVISTLFLLWPTCSERRMWDCAHMSAGSCLIFTMKLPEGGLLMVNLMLTLNCQTLLKTIRIITGFHSVRYHETCSRCEAALLNPACGVFADFGRFKSNFHLPSSSPCDVDFYGLHGRLPSVLYFIPFEINSVSFAPTQCGLPWRPLPNGLACTWICLWVLLAQGWNVLFLCSQSKDNLLIKQSKITLKCLFCSILFYSLYLRTQSDPSAELLSGSEHEITSSAFTICSISFIWTL